MFSREYFESLLSSWDRLKNSPHPVYIYGMGDGAQKLLDEFEARGISCEGFFASDDFVRGQSFQGKKVLTLAQAEELSGEITVALGFGTSLPEIMERIDDISQKHLLIAPETAVAGEENFSKERFLELFPQAKKAYDLLSDELSKLTFEKLTAYKITGDLAFLREIFTDKDKITEMLPLDDNEIYCDLGAYTGDTALEFIRRTNGQYEKIYALEPERKNFQKCEKNILACGCDNIELYNAAAWSKDCTLNFAGGAGRQGRVDAAGKAVQARSLDSVLGGRPCTYVKYDVEGADLEAIKGSRETISNYAPKICCALYHRPYDYFTLPLYINSLHKGYRFFMRQESYYPAWETNLFCIADKNSRGADK